MDKPVILVDLSSFIFYRYYAIQRWLKVSQNEGKLSEDEIWSKFEKMVETNLKGIKRKFKCEYENIFLARDCPREDIWRMAIYPQYKQTRDENRPASFDPRCFQMSYSDILPRVIKECGFKLVSCDGAEADDVIAIAHDYIRSKNPKTIINILSMDTDFIQLRSNFTEVYDFTYKVLSQKMTPDKLENYLHWKIIRGDTADNIPAIAKGVGDVTALKLAKDPEALETKLKNPEVKAAYERNKQLISFEYIPEQIKAAITASLDSIVKMP